MPLAVVRGHRRLVIIGLVILCAVSYVAQLHILLQLLRLDDINKTTPLTRHEATALVGAVVDNKHLLSLSTSSNNVHIVFSTDCTGYQHYQSIVSYYSIRRSGHLGPTTRIVSGCTPSQQHAITQEFTKIDPTKQHLRLHFTPSFSLNGKHYKYSNKPGGVLHWITNNNTTINEDVIALIDPDMVLLRPITPILKQDLTEVARKKMLEYKDKDGRIHILRQNKLPPLPLRVTKGIAAGQHFGLGGYWASAGQSDATNDFKQINLTKICGPSSPCLNEPSTTNSTTMHYTTREEADNNYAVGPVYIATTADWQDLLPKWYEFTPRVYEQYPKLLAEMYGFTMAAADRQLKFALSSSYMVSDARTMSPTESWLWIDEYGAGSARAVCDGAGIDRLPTETLRRLKHYGYGYQDNLFTDNNDLLLGAGPLPTTLHYCQRYEFANHVFAKRKIPHDFFRCDGTPMKFDIYAIMRELDSIEESGLSGNQRKVKLRMAYMICHLTPLMNLALAEYKVDMKC